MRKNRCYSYKRFYNDEKNAHKGNGGEIYYKAIVYNKHFNAVDYYRIV